MQICRIGLDLAKNVFQVHGVDGHGKTVLRRKLQRNKVLTFFARLDICTIGMEACAGSHYWARELTRQGHTVRLIAGQFVRPYRKSGKNDQNDAETICEAAGRPNMRFVPIKSAEQQAVLSVHRVRQLRVGEGTALVNQIRVLLAEYGIVVAQGITRLRHALPGILEDAENELPDLAREVFAELYQRLIELDQQIDGMAGVLIGWLQKRGGPADHAVGRYRSVNGDSDCSDSGGWQVLQEWPAVCGLVGVDPSTELKWR